MIPGNVKQFIRGINNLSTIPALIGRILSIVRDENSSPDDLYRLISHDQALSGRVVQVANSVFFGHAGQVKDIPQAIMFLGYDRIKSIAVGMGVMAIFPFHSSFNIRNLWAHSYEVAFLAGAISEMVPMMSPGECFLSGLLHDIGRIIFYRMNPKKFIEIEVTDDLLEREEEIFGCTHATAGAWFAEDMDMPAEIVSSIKFHHRPSMAPEQRDTVSVVSLAEVLVRKFNPRFEDDSVWTDEHDAILLEFSLGFDRMTSLGEKFAAASTEIERFFHSL
jgi:putative nucleotidyltransferase with HDIG domain